MLQRDIKDQLKRFIVQKLSENSPQLDQSSQKNLFAYKETLLDFIKSKMFNGTDDEVGSISCNLILEKSMNDELDSRPSCEGEQDQIFEAKVFKIIWDKQPSIAIILHDITQQHTILSLQIADTQKDKVLATVSHELRTPLNGMLGMIQIMQKQIQDQELLKYLSICSSSGQLLLGLVNSILDLNQIRFNKIRLYPEQVSIADLLTEIFLLFKVQCDQKKIYLTSETSSATPKWLITDKNRLSQILINLIGNALKFTFEGGITISVSESERRGYVQFDVRDTGLGIKEEDKEKLFKVFGRLGHADQRINTQGVGLGLNISDNLARLLGCGVDERAIKVESEYSKGTTFSFLVKKELEGGPKLENTEMEERERAVFDEMNTIEALNVTINDKVDQYSTLSTSISQVFGKMQDNKQKNQNSKSHRVKPRKITSHRDYVDPSSYILVVDDNPFNLAVAEHLLSNFGYKVRTALHGKTAIEMIIANCCSLEPITLIFMDCQMPVMDGFETTKRLKKMMTQGYISEIPIIALTANDSQADRKKCAGVGMCDYLCKPLNDKDLSVILKKYM